MSQPKTLAALMVVVCVEAARFFGDFKLGPGLYFGEFAGMLAVLTLPTIPLVARGWTFGLQLAAMMLTLMAFSSAWFGGAGRSSGMTLGVCLASAALALLLSMNASFFRPEDAATRTAKLQNPPFETIFSILIVAAPMFIGGLSLLFGAAGSGYAAVPPLGFGLTILSFLIFARNRYALLAGGLIGVATMGMAAHSVPSILYYVSHGEHSGAWLASAIVVLPILLVGLAASIQLIGDGRRGILATRPERGLRV